MKQIIKKYSLCLENKASTHFAYLRSVMAKFHNDNLKYNDFVVIKLCTLIPTEGDSAKTLFVSIQYFF